MNFSFSTTKGATEGGKFLGAGIHNAKFLGVDYDTQNTQEGEKNVMVLKLDVVGYGEYTQKFFEPESSERVEMQWGPTPSQVDHFLIAVREILEALDPQLITDLDEGKISLDGSFAKLVKSLKKYTDPYVGNEVEIKLLPGSKGYNNIPTFVAGLSKNGNLTIRTRFIGHNLTLTDRELKMIEAAKNATPTNMKEEKSTADKLRDELDVDSDEDEDLPF